MNSDVVFYEAAMPAPPLKVSLGSHEVAQEQVFERLPQLPSGTVSQSSVLSVQAEPAVSDAECAVNKACKFQLPQSVKTSFPPVRGPPVWQEAMAPADVYIGRGSHKLRLARSIWHNPYKIDKGTSRTEAVRLFEEYVAKSDHLREFLRSLSGKRLRCHCLPRQQCHGDALVRCFVKYAREAHVSRLRVYEVFCGHAGLSEKIQAAGFDPVAIDWAGNRHKPRVPIRVSNLLEDVDVEKIIGDLRAGKVFFIWMAPPCGTFSKAREIPISKAAKANGVREPRPLRSASRPWGLPILSAFEQS